MAQQLTEATSEIREAEAGEVPGLAPRDIQRKALRHTIWKLGDAIRVSWPAWTGEDWRVVLKSFDGAEEIGELYLDTGGEVLAGKSTTRDTLR
jgi:broad specificity phosphatase PhoE